MELSDVDVILRIASVSNCIGLHGIGVLRRLDCFSPDLSMLADLYLRMAGGDWLWGVPCVGESCDGVAWDW